MTGTCKGCKYHDKFTWVCCNADSPYVADFIDWGCKHYASNKDHDNDNDSHNDDGGNILSAKRH